jgi:hypothetical protein
MIHLDFDESRFSEIVKQAVTEAMATMPDRPSEPIPERKTLHSIRELADFIGCSTVTAQKGKNEGRFPFRQVGRKVLFFTDEVLKAMEKGNRKRLNNGK